MKYFLFLIIFSIFCAKSSYPNGFTSDTERTIDFCEVGNNKDYISYEFGLSKINSVYILKNDTVLDVYISDGNKINFLKTCEISPILNWAFEKAPNELASVRYVKSKEYKPLYYKLTIMVNGDPIIIDSSSMRIIGNESVVEKIEDLKRFILTLWTDSLNLNMGADVTKNTEDNLCNSLEFLPDSIKEIVSNRKLIIYEYGHHGKKWCLIYKEADSYNFKIGTTRNEPPILTSKLDTARLMDEYRDLICWGIDTLPYITRDMPRQYPKQWSGFYNSLSVLNQQSDCIFNSNNAIGFVGCDDMAINEKFSRLCYLMYWLSAPEIRSLLPGFDDYVK